MRDAIVEYFAGERSAGVLAAVVGALALAAAVVLFQPRWELRPLAIALGLMGLLELAVGVGLVVKTGPQVDGLLALLGSDAARARAEEAARMTRVQANFVVLQGVWVVLIAATVAVALTQKARPVLWSASLGVLLQATFLLVFDVVAERRGALYLRSLTDRTAATGGAEPQ